MYYKIDKVEITPVDKTLDGEPLRKVVAFGTCRLAKFQMVYHFTDSGILLEKSTPLFGCKNYDKKAFHRCVPLGTQYQSVPCPIVTQHNIEILTKVMVYLIEQGFVDKSMIRNNRNSVFYQALQIVESGVK